MISKINWTNCADEMPPNDENFKLIVVSSNGTFVSDGKVINEFEWSDIAITENQEWTLYTTEKWKFLTDG